MDTPGTLLLIAGDPNDATRVMAALAGQGQPRVEWVQSLVGALQRLKEGGVAAIILELRLPDSRGIGALDSIVTAAGHLPILVLSAAGDGSVATLAVAHGADDFLALDRLDSYSLPRAVRGMLERRTKDNALFAGKERAEVTLNSIADAVLSTDIEGQVSYLNRMAESMTGWSRTEAFGRPIAEVFNIVDARTHARLADPVVVAYREDRVTTTTPNCVLIRRDGRESPIEDSAAPIHDRDGTIVGAVVVFHDVGPARKMAVQLSHLAHFDFLTDLPNRMLLKDRLDRAILNARRQGGLIAVLFLDLDRFKNINDSLGHAVGDQVIQAAALRIQETVRRSDTVARYGGDEFVLVLSNLKASNDAAAIAGKLQTALAAPFVTGPHELTLRASIGVSVYPADGEDAETLINRADTAMYHAKKHGRDDCQFFVKEMNLRAVERRFIEEGLHEAIDRRELSLYYQPRIDLATNAIVGAEALMRWQHPVRGLILPNQFVSVAEESGLIHEIGKWALHDVCRQAVAWIDAGLRPLPLAVNISALQFSSADFCGDLRGILSDTGLDPAYLELELTERVLMKHAESSVSMLKELKHIGVRLTVDDFGTGYSSLSYLSRFPIDAFKLDQSFVQEIATASDESVTASAVISMGQSMRKRVIAEGVETFEQLAFLRGRGCEEAQGFYFHRPMVAAELGALLSSSGVS